MNVNVVVLQLESNFEKKRIKIYPNTFEGNLQLLEYAASNNINKTNAVEIVGALMRSEYLRCSAEPAPKLINLPQGNISILQGRFMYLLLLYLSNFRVHCCCKL